MMTFSGRRASQRASELGQFINVLREQGVMRYLEIGARHGDTFHEVMRSLPQGARGVAVDLPGGAWGTPSSVGALKAACLDLRKHGYRADYVLGDSTTREVRARVDALGPYDAVFIDGDHRYDGVLADWTNYGRLARRVVGFHDIDGHSETSKDGKAMPVEVPKLWEELRERLVSWDEFVDRDARGMGIGVIYI